MTIKEQVRARIIEAVPEIVELKFGCEAVHNAALGEYSKVVQDDDRMYIIHQMELNEILAEAARQPQGGLEGDRD